MTTSNTMQAGTVIDAITDETGAEADSLTSGRPVGTASSELCRDPSAETITSDAQIPDQSGIVDAYFGFIDAFGARIRHGADVDPPPSPLLDALPGLSTLLASFPIASRTERHVAAREVEDWNPLGQRLLLPDDTPAPASAFETEFSLIAMAAQTLIEWAHEAVHILAIEPWCTGAVPLANESAFREWYLGAEGLAFWYADIVVTRRIRQVVPGAELVYTRSSVSNAGFHPEEAFRRSGQSSTEALCDLYITAFLGCDETLAASDDPLARIYRERLRGFYGGSGKTLKALWSVLRQQGLIEGYWQRFCAIPGLPTLLPGPPPDSVAAMLSWIGRKVQPGLEGLPHENLEAIRYRRAAQIRAWHGWSLRWLLEKGWIFSEAPLDTKAMQDSLSRWLNALEKALHRLAAGDSADAAAQIAEADDFYAAHVKAPLAEVRAGTRYRYWIFPYFAPSGGIIGLWDSRSDYRSEEAEAVLRFVSEKADWSSESIIAQAAALEALASDEAAPQQAQNFFNSAMLVPEMRAIWSIPLWEISPAEGLFRELAFEFN